MGFDSQSDMVQAIMIQSEVLRLLSPVVKECLERTAMLAIAAEFGLHPPVALGRHRECSQVGQLLVATCQKRHKGLRP